MEIKQLTDADRNRIKVMYPSEEQRNDILGALDVYTYGLSREQTVQYARKHMVTSDTLDFADVQPNDLDLLLSNLSSVVSEPRHLDVYSIARKLIITDQQRQFAQLAPQRAEARIVLLVPAKKSIGFEIAGGIERNLPIYCKEVTFQTVRKSEYNPQGYRLQPGDEIVSINNHKFRQSTKTQAEEIIKKECSKNAHGETRLEIKVRRIGFYPTFPNDQLAWYKVPDYNYFREHLTVLVNIHDDANIGCNLLYISEKFHIAETKPNSIAARLGLEDGDEIIMINDSKSHHTSDHDFGVLFKQKFMTISYIKSNSQILTKLLDKLSASKYRERYRSTIETLKRRIRPEQQDANFLNSQSESDDVMDINQQPVPPKPDFEPAPPRARTSFIVRNNESEHKPRPSRRITINSSSVEDDLDDIMASALAKRNSVKQPSEPKRNTKAGFLKRVPKQKNQDQKQQPQQPATRKSIIHMAQEQQLNNIDETTPPRISKRVSIKEDLENANPNSYKIFKPELVKKLSGKSFDEGDAFEQDEDKDREETEKMIHASDISQIEIDLAKVTSDKPKKFMTPLELRYRNNLHMNGGHGTLSMPHDMRQKLNSKRDSFIQRYNDDPLVETISDH